MELSRWTTSREGITLVSVVVTNPHDEPVRFRLANELDGPLWPPRTNGRIEASWDADGYEGVLDPGERVSLGYATPAAEKSPAAVIERVERAEGTNPHPASERALRSFQDPRPPRDVLVPGQAASRGGFGEDGMVVGESQSTVTATEPGGTP